MSKLVKNLVYTLVALFTVACIGHIVWCLQHHINVHDGNAALTAQISELEATKASLTAQNASLTSQNAELEAKKADLIARITELEAAVPEHIPGQCNGECPLHCNVHVHEPTQGRDVHYWEAVGKAGHCKNKMRAYEIVCASCGERLDYVEEVVDKRVGHNYGSDRVCDDCGYTNPADVIVTPTPKPAATPTPKPAATPTPKPTATPTPKPTAKPTATTCAHARTEVREGSSKTWKTASDPAQGCYAEYTVTVVCKDCGKTVSAVKKTTAVENHDFIGRTCDKCGYRRQATSASGEASGTVSNYDSGTVTDQSGPSNPAK